MTFDRNELSKSCERSITRMTDAEAFEHAEELFDEQLKSTTSATARELHVVRNALEHTYVRVSEGWAKPFAIREESSDFGIRIGSDELEAKAIRVMQIARSALLHLSFAVAVEERQKQTASLHTVAASMPLF